MFVLMLSGIQSTVKYFLGVKVFVNQFVCEVEFNVTQKRC